MRQYLDINSDLCVKCPLQHLAQQFAGPKGVRRDVFVYSYGFQPDQKRWLAIYKGFAAHAAEVSMVFGNPNFPDEPFDAELSSAIQSYWGAFARSGMTFAVSNQVSCVFNCDVFVIGKPSGANLPVWKPYSPTGAVGFAINLTKPVQPAQFDQFRADRCGLWTSMDSGIVPIPVDAERVFAFCQQLGYNWSAIPHPYVRIGN